MLEDILYTLHELCLVWIRIDWAGGRNEWQDVRGDTGRDRRGRDREGRDREGREKEGREREGRERIHKTKEICKGEEECK